MDGCCFRGDRNRERITGDRSEQTDEDIDEKEREDCRLSSASIHRVNEV